MPKHKYGNPTLSKIRRNQRAECGRNSSALTAEKDQPTFFFPSDIFHSAQRAKLDSYEPDCEPRYEIQNPLQDLGKVTPHSSCQRSTPRLSPQSLNQGLTRFLSQNYCPVILAQGDTGCQQSSHGVIAVSLKAR